MKKYLSYFVLSYLRLFAQIQIRKIHLLQKIKSKNLTIVGITGSAGKSSTVRACQSALADHYTVKTTSEANSESGIPLNILNIKTQGFSPLDWIKYLLLAPLKIFFEWKSYDIYLVEMGIDSPNSPKNMSYLLTIIRPTIGIFLNVNLAHTQNFEINLPKGIKDDQKSLKLLELIGAEKAKLINQLPQTGYALINTSDPTVLKSTLTTLAKKIILQPISINLPSFALPKSFGISISAAVELAKIFGIDKQKSLENISRNLLLPPSRSSLIPSINNSTIIDSSYNSSPLATSEMLEVLSTRKSPTIAVLGDMRELGEQSATAHQKIYKLAQKSADTIISVGPETKKYFGNDAIKFDYWWQALEYLKANLPENSTILVKGSQNNIYLEEIVVGLCPNTNIPICRQSPYWQKVKSDFKLKNL